MSDWRRIERLCAENAALHAQIKELARERERFLSSTTWRLSSIPRAAAMRLPSWQYRFLRQTLRAAWWGLTPWRTAARLRFLRERASLKERAYAPQPSVASTAANYAAWVAELEAAQNRTEIAAGETIGLLLAPGGGEQLRITMQSLLAQTNGSWEALVAETPEWIGGERRFIPVPEARDLPKAPAIKLMSARSRHKWIAVLDAGDSLIPSAVAELSASLADGEVGALYSDEDKLDASGQRIEPYFKPSWSPQLLQAFNYFGRLTVLSRKLLLDTGGFEAEDGAAVEWIANLLVAEAAETSGLEVRRIERVLCHRGAASPQARPRAETVDAADYRQALRRYWLLHGLEADVSTMADGTLRAIWPIDNPPLVSIIIPNHDNCDVLRRCLAGIVNLTNYDSYEIIIVENNSRDPQTWSYYQELEQHHQIRVVRFDGMFNYSRACNFGASLAKGDLLLFLNNDVEVVDTNWLSELVRVALLPGVGVVGAKLLYPDGRLQHGGVVVGIHLFGLAFHYSDEDPGLARSDSDGFGVFGSPFHTRNWIAVMGACQMIRREVFKLVDGFNEDFRIANNDVELCIQAHLLGWRTAYTPHASLIHHEGVTRGKQNPPGDMTRSARLMMRVGIGVDPYLHSELSGFSAYPRLRAPGEPSLRDAMTINIRAMRGWDEEVDLSDDNAIASATGESVEMFSWPPQPPYLIRSEWAAARWLIDLLRRNDEVRVRFPRALTEGAEGPFGRWITGEAGSRRGLSTGAREHIRAALSGRLGARPLQLLAVDAEVLRGNPVILLPPGRLRLLRWLLPSARRRWSLRLEEIWWFLITIAEAPEASVPLTYLLTPAWQAAHPAGLTVFGREALSAWIAQTYGFRADEAWLLPADWPVELKPLEQLRLAYSATSEWRERAPDAFDSKPGLEQLDRVIFADERVAEEQKLWCREAFDEAWNPTATSIGINLIGHFCYPSGLKVSLEAIASGIEAAGGLVSRRDLIVGPADAPRHADFLGLEPYDVTLIHVQPEPFFSSVYQHAGLSPRAPRPHRVAYWYWELEEVPISWAEMAGDLDEIWAATTFVSEALLRVCKQPVYALFPGVQLPSFEPAPKQAFGLRDDGRFTFLFSFHMASIVERKNPFGVIDAFRKAFSKDDAVDLVLKTTSHEVHEEKLSDLRDAAAGSNIVIVDKAMSIEETIALTNACDAYVSLHRSEGLGLTMAEAMLLGKPVIATRYSGNLDFMDDNNSLLVDYKLTTVGANTPPYNQSSLWADPSTSHAASLMRRLFEDRAFSAALGVRAQVDARNRLSVSAAGERMMERLRAIRAQR